MGADIRVDGKTAAGARRRRASPARPSWRPISAPASASCSPALAAAEHDRGAARLPPRPRLRAAGGEALEPRRRHRAGAGDERARAAAVVPTRGPRLRAPAGAPRGARRAGVGARSSTRCARSSPTSAGAATPRSSRTRKRFDGVDARARGPIEVPRAEMAARRGVAAARRAPRPRSSPPAASTAFHRRQRQGSWSFRDATGARLGQQVRAARPGRRLRAGRHRRVSVVGADERDPGEGRGRRRGDRRDAARARRAPRCSRPRTSPASIGSSASAARRRSPRSRTARARSRASTRSAGPATSASRPPSGSSSAPSTST